MRASGLPSDRILDIAVASYDSDLVYAATQNNGLYLSTDGGVSFQDSNGAGENSLPDGAIYGIAIDPQHAGTAYVSVSGHRGGIFESTDGGGTWFKSGEFTDCYAVALPPSSSPSPRLFAGCGLQFYKSDDGGVNWDMLFDGSGRALPPGYPPLVGYIRDFAQDPGDPGVLCFVIKDDPYHDQSSGGGLYCTLDGGRTWKEVAGPLGLLLRGTAVAFDPLPDPVTGQYDLFYMTGGDGAYRIPFSLLLKVMKASP